MPVINDTAENMQGMKTSKRIKNRAISAGPGTKGLMRPFKDSNAQKNDSQDNRDSQTGWSGLFIAFLNRIASPPDAPLLESEITVLITASHQCQVEHPAEARQGIPPADNNRAKQSAEQKSSLKSGTVPSPIS